MKKLIVLLLPFVFFGEEIPLSLAKPTFESSVFPYVGITFLGPGPSVGTSFRYKHLDLNASLFALLKTHPRNPLGYTLNASYLHFFRDKHHYFSIGALFLQRDNKYYPLITLRVGLQTETKLIELGFDGMKFGVKF